MTMNKTYLALFCGSFFSFCSTSLWAQENSSTELDTVVVRAKNFSQQIGTQKITEQEIERRPTTNGNITDLLKTNPNVRFSTGADGSNSGGEIKPSEISFHGEKFYNNNFVLNGMSNNDNINPGSDNSRLQTMQPKGSMAYDLPGGDTQSFWIDSSLLKSVEAFDSNVSAKYGNFTGGVVDAKLKDPSFDKWNSGKIYYRRTQDSWASFHVDDEANFERAVRLDFQPKFTKEQYGIIVNQKLSEKASMRFNYTRTQSEMDYYHPNLAYRDAAGVFGHAGQIKNNQTRVAETFMINGVYLPDNGDLWRATVIYSPHKAKYFKRDTKDGAFETTGGGIQANIEWEKQFDNIKMTSYLGYKRTGNKVEHEAQNYRTYTNNEKLAWKSDGNNSREGGYGTFETDKTIYTAKQDFNVTEFDWGESQHKLSFGWQADFAKAKYIRDNDSYNYSYERQFNYYPVCNGAEACIDGDQYAWKKLYYYARNVKANDNSYSAYVEDNFSWKNLSVALGARYDYNQFLGKHNLAQRTSASYDVFGDEKTRIFTGFNRYYSGSMLAYKMRQGISNYLSYERNQFADGTVGPWLAPAQASNNTYDVAKLKNPYSDEIVLGLGQKAIGANWIFKWVHRNGRDQFVNKTVENNGRKYSSLSNDGWQKNDTFTISVSPLEQHKFKYANVSWNMGFSYNRTKTNNRWYDTEELGTNEYLMYNNRLYYADGGSMPTDFNNPYQVFLNVNTEFPQWRLTWDQRFSYIGGKDYIYSDGTISCNGSATPGSRENRAACGSYVGVVDSYKDAHQASHFLVDWRFAYKQPVVSDQYIEVTLDVNNVLNKRAVAKAAGGNTLYKMGRNFWLGASYNW